MIHLLGIRVSKSAADRLLLLTRSLVCGGTCTINEFRSSELMSCSGSGLFAILCFLLTTGICSELLLFRDCRLKVSDSHLASCMFSMDFKTWDEMSSVCGE